MNNHGNKFLNVSQVISIMLNFTAKDINLTFPYSYKHLL